MKIIAIVNARAEPHASADRVATGPSWMRDKRPALLAVVEIAGSHFAFLFDDRGEPIASSKGDPEQLCKLAGEVATSVALRKEMPPGMGPGVPPWPGFEPLDMTGRPPRSMGSLTSPPAEPPLPEPPPPGPLPPGPLPEPPPPRPPQPGPPAQGPLPPGTVIGKVLEELSELATYFERR